MKTPKIFSRKRRHTTTYYVEINGKQFNLGADRDEARKEYGRLLSSSQPVSATTTVAALVDRFLDDLDRNAKARKTFEWYKRHLDSFLAYLEKRHNGALTIDKITGDDVSNWLGEFYTKSGPNNQFNALRAVSRVFNWYRKKNPRLPAYNPVNEIDKGDRPEYEPRECELKPEDWRTFLAAVKPGPFRDILIFLRLTGARPNEACIAEVRHFDRERRHLKFDKKESKGKKKQRVVPLPDEAFEIIQRLALAAGDGPIFKTQRGAAWSNSSLNSCFDNVERRTGVKLHPYMLRHAFVTDQMAAGMDPVTLAKICGHSDLKMILSTYDGRDTDKLLAAMKRTNVA